MPTYDERRSKIHTGDTILWKGAGILSKCIMKFTPFSHASLVVRFNQAKEVGGKLQSRVFLVEALSAGLQFRLLSQRLLEDVNAQAFHLPARMTMTQIELSREHALIECGKNVRYDYGSLLKNITGRVSSDASAYFCSEFVWLNWIYSEVIDDSPTDKAPRPGDLPSVILGTPIRIRY